VGADEARGHRQVQRDHIPGLPAPRQEQVARLKRGSGRLAVDLYLRCATPVRDAQAQPPRPAPGLGDGDLDQAVPGVVGRQAQGDRPRAGHVRAEAGRRVLVNLHFLGADRCQVDAQRGDQTHDVGRAARALEPRLAGVRFPHKQRVNVEEGVPLQGDAAEEPVVERALDQRGVARFARDPQQAPVPHDAGDGRAGLAVTGVVGQLVRLPERFIKVARARAAGDVHLAGGEVVPLAQHRVQ